MTAHSAKCGHPTSRLEIMSIFKYLTLSQVFFMELRQLESLCLIARHGTVKEAAKRSFLTSSAVSLQIKTLERELGVQLLSSRKKIGAHGKRRSSIQDAQRILESVREALARTLAATGDFTGKISMVAPACLRNSISRPSPAFRHLSIHSPHDPRPPATRKRLRRSIQAS